MENLIRGLGGGTTLSESYYMVNSVTALFVAAANVEVDSFCVEAGDTVDFST